MGADYADDQLLLANAPAQVEFQLHNLKQAAGGINFYMNSDRTEFRCFEQHVAISTLNNKPLKLVDHITYLSSNFSSTEINVTIGIEKVWATIDRLLIIGKSNLIK